MPERWPRFSEAEWGILRDPSSARWKGTAMKKFASAIRLFLSAEDGPTAVEYAIMLTMIILACFTAIVTVGTQTNSIFQKAASSIH